jgi:hypothetical protein
LYRDSGESRVRSEAFQRYPGDEHDKFDAGFSRYNIRKFIKKWMRSTWENVFEIPASFEQEN